MTNFYHFFEQNDLQNVFGLTKLTSRLQPKNRMTANFPSYCHIFEPLDHILENFCTKVRREGGIPPQTKFMPKIV